MTTQVVALPAPAAELAAQIELVRQAAMEVFGNCRGVELMHDPECTDESWYVIHVVDRIDSNNLTVGVQRESRWHDRIRELIPDALDRFCVSVTIEA
jgi:hypothetical protein